MCAPAPRPTRRLPRRTRSGRACRSFRREKGADKAYLFVDHQRTVPATARARNPPATVMHLAGEGRWRRARWPPPSRAEGRRAKGDGATSRPPTWAPSLNEVCLSDGIVLHHQKLLCRPFEVRKAHDLGSWVYRYHRHHSHRKFSSSSFFSNTLRHRHRLCLGDDKTQKI